MWGQRWAVVALAVLVVVAWVLALWVSPVLNRDVEKMREALAI